jgi:hypothetical protein
MLALPLALLAFAGSPPRGVLRVGVGVRALPARACAPATDGAVAAEAVAPRSSAPPPLKLSAAAKSVLQKLTMLKSTPAMPVDNEGLGRLVRSSEDAPQG